MVYNSPVACGKPKKSGDLKLFTLRFVNNIFVTWKT